MSQRGRVLTETAYMQVAAGLMSACLPAGTGAARLMLFVGGPPTCGPGKVVDTDLQEPIRSHKVLCCNPSASLTHCCMSGSIGFQPCVGDTSAGGLGKVVHCGALCAVAAQCTQGIVIARTAKAFRRFTLHLAHCCAYSLQDLAKDSAPHYKAGRKVFDALALQLVAQAHALDVFACSLDQASLPQWTPQVLGDVCKRR